MAKRDVERIALQREIDALSAQLRAMLPDVLDETGIRSIQSLNGLYGGKYADYIDIQNEVILSPDHFVALYLEGFVSTAEDVHSESAHRRNLALLRDSPKLKEFLYLFLKRTYLRNIDALSKKRPPANEAAVWIGQNNADYGLLVTPRFSSCSGQWENDKSEIRHFEHLYWSIGHVLETGLVVPGKNERISFASVEEYLDFFLNVLVRNSGSEYEYALGTMYREYALDTPEPERVPLLIPEFRYAGLEKKHGYRLDFTIIDPYELTRIAFELSPWSTHGHLAKIGELSQGKINAMARDNFEKEMRKHKDFFRRHGVFALIYTDSDLNDLVGVFADMRRLLEPKTRSSQLRFRIIHDILDTAPER